MGVTTGFLRGTLLLHAGRDETLAMGNVYYDRLAEWCKLTPYQQKGKPNPGQMVIRDCRGNCATRSCTCSFRI